MHKINYIKTFALIIRRELLKIFLAIAVILGIILIQINIIEIYLENALGQNKQPIYMKISQKCLAGQKSLVCKILKSLYELKQARKL